MSLSAHAKLALAISVIESQTSTIGSPTYPISANLPFDFPNGTSNGNVNQIFAGTRNLAASTAEDLDLSGNTLKDGLNNGLAFAKVLAIVVYAHTTNGSTVSVKPGASNGFTGPFGAATHKLSLPAGGLVALVHPTTGWTVTAATGDLFNVANDDSGAAANYDIYIIGHS